MDNTRNSLSPERETAQSEHSVNRNYKAGLFTHLFGEPKNELELYNAFSPIQYPPDTPVIDLTLNDVLFMDRVNDLSFSVGGKLVVFFEHSSTINENIPLRYLTYCGRVYEKLIDNKAIYFEHRMAIPTPEFYVIYNGIRPFPEKKTYRLSESYIQAPCNESPLELVVTAYNVNKGYNDDIVSRSKNLQGYVTLVSKVRDYEHSGMKRPEAVTKAVKDCIAEGILSEYLKSNASEVSNMLIQDWDWDTAKEVWQAEAREEGRARGREEGRKEGREEGRARGREEGESMGISKGITMTAKNMLLKGYTDAQIIDATGLSAEDLSKLRKEANLVSEQPPEYQQKPQA